MHDARWDQLKDLFFEAVEKAPAEREAWMAQLDDADLRAALEQLLADDAAASSLLDAPAEVLAGLVEPAPDGDGPPTQIGPYRILDELGRGGMGAVYLAERADGMFEQRVALKVVRRGLATGDLVRRFEQERQILAALSHDHIARLLDGGTGPDGLPYLVMECIDGEPITRYCDTHRLPVEARLRLFQDACAAVQYAHQNLVVHRDLKPSNMLVTADGRLKLLDFGIAKLLADDRADPLQTQTGMRVLTPAYASPEQLRGGAISTASDIYTLGVILYELLTGQRPYTVPPEQEAGAFVATVQPPRPSTAVTTTADTEAVGAARSTTPERLRRRLAGDLDTIVLKALRKEPERRYASAEAFLDDIRRHLDGLPVRAQPDTLGYRARKFVQRHRVGVAMAAAAVVLLLGFAVAMALQQAQTARALARAEVESEKSERVADFLMGLFEANDPREAGGEDLTAQVLLERGVAEAEALADQPEVQAQLLDVIGQVYWSLGRYAEAVPLLEQGLALRRGVWGEEHPDVALSLDNLGRIQGANGNYELSDSLHRLALGLRRQVLGEEHADVAVSLSNLAIALSRQGRYEEAAALHRESLALRRRLFGDEHLKVAIAQGSLAEALRRQGEYTEAESLHREALALRRRLLGNEHEDVAGNLNGLAMVLWRQGRYEEAEGYLRESLALRRTLLGEAHPTLATTIDNLGLLLKEQGKLEEAEQMHRASLAMYRTLLGDGHPNVATSLHNLASVLTRQKKYIEAESVQRTSLAIYRQELGEAHPFVAVSLDNLATIYRGQERYAEAVALHQEALTLRRAVLGEAHPNVAVSLINLGVTYQQQGRYADAQGYLSASLALRRTVLGNEHPSTLNALGRLAAVLTAQEAYDASEPLHREALALAAKLRGEAHWQAGYYRSELGGCLVGQGRYAEAESLLVQAHALLTDTRGTDDANTQKAADRLVALYTAWGRPDKARAYQNSVP